MFRLLRHLLWIVPSFFLLVTFLWPRSENFLQPRVQSLHFLDRTGKLLYEWRREGSASAVPLKEIPQSVRTALIAIEDRRFSEHWGVSPRAIIRAAYQNISAGRIVSGGSTITQQLVHMQRTSDRRSIVGKVIEAFLALSLELRASKEEILEAYLNNAYFGHGAYGIAAAARTYLGKSVAELSLSESAFLVGLLQSPSTFDPFRNFDAALKRQGRVLSAMQDAGFLSEEERADARANPPTLAEDRVMIEAPHFVLWLLTERSEELMGVKQVRTTIDLSLQRAIERIIERHLEALAEHAVTSASVVVLDARSGDILAMVGSADYFNDQYSGAVNVALAPRQPGSALKPFTYALALAQGDTAASTVADTASQFLTEEGNPYTPRNYDYGEHGLVRYREALANSYNIAAVKVLEQVGVGELQRFLQDAGISTLTEKPDYYGLALTLGSGEVTLLELSQAYALFPRGGTTLRSRALLSDPVQAGEQILDPRIAWLISDILSDNSARLPEFGEESPLRFDFPVAAKTGTTRNSRDNWTIGFTPEIVVGVWVGNADNSPMRGTSGITGAAPIFHDVMEEVMKGRDQVDFAKPDDIITLEVCRLSGKLPTALCPQTLREHFIVGTEPRQSDDLYQEVAIDVRNALRATENCPPEFVHTDVFTVFPKEVSSWAREQGWKVPPAGYSPLCSALPSTSLPWIEITSPQPGDSFQLDPLIPDQYEQLSMRARAATEITTAEWFVDGEPLGSAEPPDYLLQWQPVTGSHLLEVRGGGVSDMVHVEVMAPTPLLSPFD